MDLFGQIFQSFVGWVVPLTQSEPGTVAESRPFPWQLSPPWTFMLLLCLYNNRLLTTSVALFMVHLR